MQKILTPIFTLFISFSTFAQQTGSWEMYVPFNGGTKLITFLVPDDYDHNTPTKLIIGLHGSGGTATGFRTSLTGLSTKSVYPTYKCIVVCPDGGNPSDPDQNFHYPAGDEEIIKVALDTAKAMYNIDPAATYLLGWSIGGRSALEYGLENYDLFSGLHLWTPAIQNTSEAMNTSSKIHFMYENGVKIPICITVGTSDSFYGPIKIARDSLLAANCPLEYKEFSGGHSGPPQQYMIDCFNHLDVYTGIEPKYNEVGKYVHVYPNPSNGIFQLQSNVPVNEVTSVKVYDLLGKTVFQVKGEATLQQLNYQLDLSTQTEGIYFIETQTLSGSFVEKVLLQ